MTGPAYLRPGDRFDTPVLRADLRTRLLDAIEWCLPRAHLGNARDCLRTPALRPHEFSRDRYAAVNDVVWERHVSLREVRGAERDGERRLPARLADGRLLVWYRDSTIDDGVGESLTSGYLDRADTPPWDTWIAYVEPADDPRAADGYLLSWVPPPFVEWVDSAITQNAYDAMFWLRGSQLLLERVLREEGLLE